MASCFAHATVEAVGTCDDCKRPICNRCTKGTLDGFMCPPCAHKRYARRRLVTGLKVGAVVVGLVGIAVAGLVIVGKGSERGAGKPAADAGGDRDPLIAALREQRDQAPCDKVMVRKLIDELARMDRYADVVDDSNRFFAKCGPFPRLEWKVVYALQQLGRYAEAVKHETVLIEDDPFDSDFWWWRGADRAHVGHEAAAVADYRQSFANSDGIGAARFAAERILDVAGPGDQPCEGVAALDFFVEWLGGSLHDDLTRRVRGLDQSAQCASRRGTGTTILPLAPTAGQAAAVDATVATTPGRFLVDERCGTTVVTTAFAARAGLTARAAAVPIQTLALGAVRTGAAASADITIGTARVPTVELIIVDGLPPDVDGVIGLSYVWKFRRTIVDTGIELSN